MYYTIEAEGDDNGMMIGFNIAGRKYKGNMFQKGVRLYPRDHPTATNKQKEPEEPVILDVKAGREKAPLPSFLSQPTPVMSKQLLGMIRSAGVNNIDAYKTELYYADGAKVPGEYYIVNIIGLIRAADMDKSVYDPNQPEKLIAMSFDSLTIVQSKTYVFLMFRLAESISKIIVHESVVKAVEEANIPYVRFFKTEEIAVL